MAIETASPKQINLSLEVEKGLELMQDSLTADVLDLLSSSVSVGLLGSFLDSNELPPFYINDKMLALCGYDTKEEFFALMAQDSFAVVHPEDKEKAHAAILAGIEHHGEYECQYRLVSKNGTIFWISEHGKKSFRSGHEILLAAFVDITNVISLQLEAQDKNDLVLSSLEYASRLQRNLLPTEAQLKSAFADYAVRWFPKSIVGGDFYWLKHFEAGSVLCVCDCTGHGVPGAMLAMLVSTTLESIVTVERCQCPASILLELDRRGSEILNAHEQENSTVKDGCDIAILFICNDGSVTFSSANISVYISNGEQVQRIRGQRVYIGEGRLTSADQLETTHIPANPDHTFFIASDGLFDQIGESTQKAFGHPRFSRLILEQHENKLETAATAIWADFVAHQGQETRRDDVELICFKPKIPQ